MKRLKQIWNSFKSHDERATLYHLLTAFIPTISADSIDNTEKIDTEKIENDKSKIYMRRKFAKIYFKADIVAMAVNSLIS